MVPRKKPIVSAPVTLFFDDWRGYVIAGFSLVWLTNVYKSFFGRLRLEIREDRFTIGAQEAREHSDLEMAPTDSRPPRGPAS